MKTLLKNLFVPLLASKFVSDIARSILGSGIPVFLIHRIITETNGPSGTSVDHLRRCLQYLTDRNYTFISLEELLLALTINKKLPEKPVVFTLDDGFQDQADNAIPLLLEYNCSPTFFIITDMIDKNIWPWDAKISWIIDQTAKTEIAIHFMMKYFA